MKRQKVLILDSHIMHYRLPIFKILAQKYDLTVGYTYGKAPDSFEPFKCIKLDVKKIWKFIFHRTNIHKLCCQYDTVICCTGIQYVNLSLLALWKKRNFKLLYWNIGAPASYHRKYGEASKIYYAINDFIEKRADGLISYSDTARNMHIDRGFDPHKLFVANNTVEVPQIDPERKRDCIMFIGTLYPQKGLPKLLNAYKQALQENPNIFPLEIIGDGIMRTELEETIEKENLSDKIHLCGALYTAEEKSKIFRRAYACISPGQGGLGVLESMGYGVPFITHKNAITGGEAFNIQNGVTGIRFESIRNLKEIIIDINKNPIKYEAIGINAYNHYWSCRKPQDMANGIIEAIELS